MKFLKKVLECSCFFLMKLQPFRWIFGSEVIKVKEMILTEHPVDCIYISNGLFWGHLKDKVFNSRFQQISESKESIQLEVLKISWKTSQWILIGVGWKAHTYHIPFTIFPWRVIKFHSVIIFVCIGHNEITSYEYGKGMFYFFFSWCSNMSCKELGEKTIIFWYIIFFKKKAPHMVFYSFRGNPKFVGISSCFMPQEEEKASSNRNKKKLEQNCWRQLFTF